MTPERWRQITALFHLARARDRGGRSAVLAEACAGDVALRADVEEMLAADRNAGRFGDTPAFAAAGPAPCLTCGSRFGLYRIDALLGSGGMGEVYRAHDDRLDRDVAIKLLSATVCDSDARLRLVREARSAAALNHPHICTIYEVGETDGHAYIAMELIEGSPLDQLIPAGGFPLADILRYGLQIADAIAHAHARGVVHRDLKPANVMVSQSGMVKVLDFGLAQVLPRANHPGVDLTANPAVAGVVVGTAAYMSPEQALGRSTDQRSDIFAFGTLLYEMATGRAAFNGETPIDLLDAVLHAEPQAVSSLRIDLPAEVSEVMQKALAKDPAQRYQDVSELASDLSGWLDTPTAGASSRVSNNRVGRLITFAALAAAVSTAVVWNGVPAVPNTSVTTPAPVPIEDVTAGKSRVAVLPFENLTRQSDDDWLANAFSDSLTLGLQSLDGLLLVSRSGIAQAYRDHGFREADRQEPENILRLSKSLGIRYYVHGSYQRIGNQVRVVARLVEIGPGTIKTQESVTDELANLLQLEETLARKFAASLESGGAFTSRGPETTSLAAYRAITEGRGSYASGRWREALESFRRGVDLDPEYAEAWALLGKTYARLSAPATFSGGSFDVYRSRALTAARRAVELDASSYEGQIALALANRESSQVDLWRAAARKAIMLNPRFAEGYALFGDSYAETHAWGCGRDRDTSLAVSYYRQALRIDPSVTSYHFILANYLRAGGRPQEALRAADDGLRVHPNHFSVRRARAIALIALGRVDEAERELRTAMVDSAPRLDDEINLASINLKRGHLETAANGFRKAEAAGGHGWGTLIARHYIEAGLPGPALVHLEEAFRSEPACAQWLLTTQSPYWAIVRGDPQARALIETYTAQ